MLEQIKGILSLLLILLLQKKKKGHWEILHLFFLSSCHTSPLSPASSAVGREKYISGSFAFQASARLQGGFNWKCS